MHGNRQAARQTNGDVTCRGVQRGLGEDSMVAHELNRNGAGPGFHLRALAQVVQLNAAAAGGDLYPSVRTGEAHAAAAGIGANGATHVAKEEIAAIAAGAQVAVTLTHLDTPAAGLDRRALGSSYIHLAAANRHPRLPADVVNVNVATAAAESEVCAEVATFDVAAPGGDGHRAANVVEFNRAPTGRTEDRGGE